MNTPLVSVLIPVYNAAQTLPTALASLMAQTYENWEAIVVDDGSTDGSGALAAQIHDPRLISVRLAPNQGRAAARQAALNYARGELIAKLDADDWIYPDKLVLQVQAMADLPEVALVSTGIAVVDAAGHLIGVRARGPAWPDYVVQQPLRRPAPPPLAHAPSMLRAEAARRYRYDPALRRAEDADFLLHVLLAHPFCVLHNVTYAYGEYHSSDRAETLSAYRYRMRIFQKWVRRYPLASSIQIGKAAARWMTYQAAFTLGLEDRLVRRRSQAPAAADADEYAQALATVLAMRKRLFGVDALERRATKAAHSAAGAAQPKRQRVHGP